MSSGKDGDPYLLCVLPLPVALRTSVLALQSRLAAPSWELSLSAEDDLQLPLQILGATPARVIDDLQRELGALCHARRPFDLALQGLGAFPSLDDPRSLWVGMEDPHARLQELFEASRRCLNAYRLFKLRDNLQAQLPVARVQRLSAAWSPQPLAALASSVGRLGVLPVERLKLLRRRAKDEPGPRYETLVELQLQA